MIKNSDSNRKRIYISADYSEEDGDREVIEILNKWADDDKHAVDFVDMAKVVSGSVSNNPDCRICDLKGEFNNQIKASSIAVFIIGDKTASRMAGTSCKRSYTPASYCSCTPYKENAKGSQPCKHMLTGIASEGVGSINTYSYIRHEFEQAKKLNKQIVIIYNSSRKEEHWLPSYMKGYEENAHPFWEYVNGQKVSNYSYIKEELGYYTKTKGV